MSDQPVTTFDSFNVDTGTTNRLHELIELYLHWHTIENHTRRTVGGYRKELGAFARFMETRGFPLEVIKLQPIHIMAHLAELKQAGRAPRTIRTRRTAIYSFLEWARMWEFIGQNPCEKVPPPKVPKTRKSFLKPEWFQSLLALCPLSTLTGSRNQSLLWMFITTGMRLAEMAALRKDDLDWQKGIVRVRMGKGQKERLVPFHKEAQKAVMRYLAHRKDSYPDLWITEESIPLTYWGVQQTLHRMVERAGLRDKLQDACHILRRTWAAHAVRSGIPRPYIQLIAGWSTPTMLDHYTAWMSEEEEEALKAFQEFSPFGANGEMEKKPKRR